MAILIIGMLRLTVDRTIPDELMGLAWQCWLIEATLQILSVLEGTKNDHERQRHELLGQNPHYHQ